MRKKLLVILLLTYLCASAQTVISISNPETWTYSQMSQYVGQTVTFETPLYVTNNYSNSYYEVSPRRIFSPTNQAFPSTTEYNAIVGANSSGVMRLYGVSGYHRTGERILRLTAKVTSSNQLTVVGDVKFVGNTREDLLEGHQDIGNYNVKVCALNMEYYLVENLGTGYGADDESQLVRQHAKLLNALAAVKADIYGLMEIEQGQAALSKMAAALTTRLGHTYTYINDGGASSGSYTKVGYIYRSDKLTTFGQMQHIDNPSPQRRKKAAAFVLKENGEKFIFSLNHFKAKTGTATGDNKDQGDGQGSYNATRVKEAKAVVEEAEEWKRYFVDEDILVMGDLNAYAKEDPIKVFTDAGYIDLHRAFHADSSYSYAYRGAVGYLDHALANPTLYKQITGMTAYHINSDERDAYTYDKSTDNTMFRSSDHDPVIVGLALGGDAGTGIENFWNNPPVSCLVTEQLPFIIQHAQGGRLRIYSLMGINIADEEINSDYYECKANLSPGIYIANVYGDAKVVQLKIIVN